MNNCFLQNWQDCHQQNLLALPLYLCGWFTHPGSFIERLKQCGAHAPMVRVLEQSWQAPDETEKQRLGLEAHDICLVREVLIYSGKNKWMYARTIFPRHILTGKLQRLKHLKNRSLGSVLFNDPTLLRSEFEMAHLLLGNNEYEKVVKHVNVNDKELWARRSVFSIQGKKLLLTEVFLPDMEVLACVQKN